MNIVRLVLCLILASAVFVPVQPVYAQEALDEFKKPLPEFPPAPVAEFESKTTLFNEDQFSNKALSYSVRLPSTWTKAEDVGGDLDTNEFTGKIFTELARYYSPPRSTLPPARFSVRTVQMDYQITAAQWFIQYLLSNGYTIQGAKVSDDSRVEAVYVLMERDVSYVVRALCRVIGSRVVLAEYYLPVEDWETEKILQNQSIDSFKMTTEDTGLAEPMESYRFLDVAILKYPKSWEFRSPPVRSLDRMQAEILNIPPKRKRREKIRTLNGQIGVELVSAYAVESLEKEMDGFKKLVADRGLVLKDPVEIKETFNFNKLFEFGKVEAYKVADAKSDHTLSYEYWIAVMLSGDYYYFMTLLTPGRDDDLYVWSRNTQTYKLMLEMLEPQSDTIVKQD